MRRSENQEADSEIRENPVISLGFQKRVCCKIVPINEKQCGCLKDIRLHGPEASIDQSIKKWTRELCTQDDGPTDAFGKILFQTNNSTPSEYIRLSYETKTDNILKYMFDTWSLYHPKLIISVTGGAKVMLKQKLKDSFCRNLAKVASSTHAWVTSGGSYNGCMKIVGEAFRENSQSIDPSQRIVVLGIASWCSVTNKELLTNKNGAPVASEVEYELIKPLKKEGKHELLDPNHSHFILIDDALNNFGGEVKSRASLEAELSRREKIPIVVLVIGGGPRTAESVYEAVSKNTPCVFLDNSGDLCNVFCYAMKRLEEKAKKKAKDKSEGSEKQPARPTVDVALREEIRAQLCKEYPDRPSEYIQPILEWVLKCLDPRFSHLLTMCPVANSKAEIDVAILLALLKSEQSSAVETDSKQRVDPAVVQLKLALEWNRTDIIKNYIFDEEVKDNINTFGDLMYQAIKNNRVEFVDLFLENGFSIRNFLTPRVLLKLYNEDLSGSLLVRVLNKENFIKYSKSKSALGGQNRLYTFKDIGNVVEYLVNDFYQHEFTKLPYSAMDHEMVNKILSDTDSFGKKNPQTIGIFTKDKVILNADEPFAHPEHQLFLYCILLGRIEMAKLFCHYGKNQIMACLFAIKILQSYNSIFDDLADDFEAMANVYEEYALGLLRTSYIADSNNAELMLLKRVAEYDKTNCIQAATSFDNLEIIAHPCFQNVVTKVWYYKISPESSGISMLFSLLCPPLAPFLLQYRDYHQERLMDQVFSSMVNEDPTSTSPSDKQTVSQTTRRDKKKKKNGCLLGLASYLKKIYFFYQTPLIKFFYYEFWYYAFLVLLSYVTLCDFHPIYMTDANTSLGLVISIPEVVLIIWFCTLAMDEVRKLYIIERKKLKAKLLFYLDNSWNLLSLIGLFIYFVSMILRFIPDDNCYLAARILLSIDTVAWFLRSLYGYTFLKSLGPKILMIKQMFIEMLYFLLIMVLFIFAFGISTHSMLFGRQALDGELLRQVFFPAFWILGGQYYTRDILMFASQDLCTNDTVQGIYDSCPDQTGSNVTLALYVVYLLFLNILLINLLIAIFNNIYDSIEKKANQIWRSQRYQLVLDFYHQPLLAPPLIFFAHILRFGRFLINMIIKLASRVKHTRNPDAVESKSAVKNVLVYKAKGFVHEFHNPKDENRIYKWQSFVKEELEYFNNKHLKETIEYKLNIGIAKLDSVYSRFDDLFQSGNPELEDKLVMLSDSSETLSRALNK